MTGKMIRYLTLLVLVLGLTTACPANNNDVDPNNGPPVDTEEPTEAELISMGEPLYEQNCARCHGADGGGLGGTYPMLAGSDMVTGDPEPVIEVIVHGRGAMPAFGGEFNNEEVAAVVTYIRNAWGNDASAVSPGDVEDVR